MAPILVAVALGWTGWVSLALIDGRERLARLEAKMDLMLSGQRIVADSPPDAKEP